MFKQSRLFLESVGNRSILIKLILSGILKETAAGTTIRITAWGGASTINVTATMEVRRSRYSKPLAVQDPLCIDCGIDFQVVGQCHLLVSTDLDLRTKCSFLKRLAGESSDFEHPIQQSRFTILRAGSVVALVNGTQCITQFKLDSHQEITAKLIPSSFFLHRIRRYSTNQTESCSWS
jgi:hypothetical protein